MEKKINDDSLGTILLRTSPRASKYSISLKRGGIVGTMPLGGDEKILLQLIEEYRKELQSHIEKQPSRAMDESTRLATHTFDLRIIRQKQTRITLTSTGKREITIACPLETDFTAPRTQDLLHNTLQEVLRQEAKRILPNRLRELATRHGFSYQSVKIQSSTGRWGSCSGRKSINLSLSLMLLPEHLMDYVILHELCHTREMNHSDAFWAQLNSVTNGKALALRNELKGHTTW